MVRAPTHPELDPSTPPDRVGSTRIDDCCTFSWTQRSILRHVVVDPTHHYDCVHKLLRRPDPDRVAIVLVYRTRGALPTRGTHERQPTYPGS
jgi:hypothetical protein